MSDTADAILGLMLVSGFIFALLWWAALVVDRSPQPPSELQPPSPGGKRYANESSTQRIVRAIGIFGGYFRTPGLLTFCISFFSAAGLWGIFSSDTRAISRDWRRAVGALGLPR